MIKVAALTSGTKVPSARFRVRQHIGPLENLGFDVHEYVPAISKYGFLPGWPKGVDPKYGLPLYVAWQGAKLATRIPGVVGSWRSSITWLERSLLAGIPTLERFLKQPLVLDVDDAIWLTPPLGKSSATAIARRARAITAGNRFLADWFSDYSDNVHVVPTAIDTDRFRTTPAKEQDVGKFVIGWTGLASNLPYLYAIEKPLRRFMQDFTDTELRVIADEPPVFSDTSSMRIHYLPWSPEIEAQALRAMHVGLMPLPDDDWTRGKCSFKMLQYMSCGKPVVVSPVGMNAEILALGRVGLAAEQETDWYEALEYLYTHRGCAQEYGKTGRSVVEGFFSRKVVAVKLAHVFRELY